MDSLCKDVYLSEKDWEREKPNVTYGLLEGVTPYTSKNIHKVANNTAWVNANEEILLRWQLWYPAGNERPSINLRIFVLLDGRQLDHALPKPGLYNDIVLERGEDKSFAVAIPPLEPGIHDIVAIGIPYLEEYPNEYGIVVLTGWRFTLIAEPAPTPPFRNIDFTTLPAEGSNKHNDPAMALELTLKKDGIDVWNWPHPWLDIRANTPLTFYALGGHQDVTNLDAPAVEPLKSSFSAFLLFVDYQQVEIAPNQTVLYAKMDSDTAYARLPITIKPLPPGKHHILVLRIDTPGVPMCILRGDTRSRILPNSVHGKLVGVNVLPEK